MYHYIEAKIIITVIPSLIKLNFEILIYFEKKKDKLRFRINRKSKKIKN